MAAAAFHIGGYAARAFSLFAGDLATLNLASYERSLIHLMRRDFRSLRDNSADWLRDPINSDAGVVEHLTEREDFSVDDAVAVSLTRTFHVAIGYFEGALLTGEARFLEAATDRIERGVSAAAESCHVPLWWSFTVARHLFDDLWGNTLHELLPSEGGPPEWPRLRRNFIALLSSRPVAEIDLWPSQIDAARRVLDASDDLVVALPTSAGKTRIAELCILRTLAQGQRVVYVTPLRALSAQVESSLARTFRPLGFAVTSVYGASGVAVADLDTFRSAHIVVATPEKLDFAIRQEPSIIDDIGLIVLDEGHMIGLSEREIRYEMLVQRLLRRGDAGQRRLVCLSAVFSEGDAFDDFVSWLRSDVPGTSVRSTWRPTRQRPGLLEWRDGVAPLEGAARLELEVGEERPYLRRFVEERAPTGRRSNAFPQNAQELVVAATSSFLELGHSVLVYCPIKSSVQATAEAFLKARRQGYFSGALGVEHVDQLADALRLGREWLGEHHPAVKSLPLGIAVHHGSLPRQFLTEIESLLKRRVLPICISSPTLAQGLDLCFSVLLFRSLYRNRRLIPPKEFANVVGRVGRAFVDLDGIYVLPVYEATTASTKARAREFRGLVTAARQRQLESGVRQLIAVIISVLQTRLGLSGEALSEYLLNSQSPWTIDATEDDDKAPGVLVAALNELDTAILGVIDVLELPIEEVADYLDACLQSSYWQRRLQRDDAELKRLQEEVFRGRAHWLWARTNVANRKGLFAAGVGYGAGHAIEEHADRLNVLLRSADEAIQQERVEDAIPEIREIAEIVFAIHPFTREEGNAGWPDLLAHWVRGTALSDFADNTGVGFIQNDVVFRLVWGVEAARLHLHLSSGADSEIPGGSLALCLTYGVPNRCAALFMQAGMPSRTLACSLAERAQVTFADMDELHAWVESIRQGVVPNLQWENEADAAEWHRFFTRFEYRQHATWRDVEETIPVVWIGTPPGHGEFVRVVATDQERRATVLTVSLLPIGEALLPETIRSNHLFARVSDDQQSLDASFFGF
ncbi:MAG: DEAD/DEAH box helicase [Planctomycetota bacterium]|nr:DEAD/DEAH box helicase [Planctomycetota bacterium]